MGKGKAVRSPVGEVSQPAHRDLLGSGGLWVPARSVPVLLPPCSPAHRHVPLLPRSTARDRAVPKHLLPDKMPLCLHLYFQ